ncbi:hypothetical protein L5515_011016 [Caenorhabditis briggsae]|uniref:Uncharacterized protein n=2 Tax=Caenorhabditis briggsae TaxID=6238 RepID=A0AAE9JFV3_CAEBR|nr:hypothetical protein L5515_011016 [Caenorhabditis briggsae]
MTHPFQTDPAKRDEYLLKLYNERYSITQAHQKICEMIKDGKMPEDDQSTESRIAGATEERPRKRKRTSPRDDPDAKKVRKSENEETGRDQPSTSSSLGQARTPGGSSSSDNRRKAKRRCSQRSEEMDTDVKKLKKSSEASGTSEGAPTAISDDWKDDVVFSDDYNKNYIPDPLPVDDPEDPIQITVVENFFKMTADLELDAIVLNGSKTVSKLEDVLKLFHIRRISAEHCSICEKYTLRMKAIRWITGYENFKIQITNDLSTVEITYKNVSNGTVVKCGNENQEVFIEGWYAEQLAATDLVFLFLTENLRLDLLAYDIEAYDEVRGELFPEIVVLEDIYIHLENEKNSHSIDVENYEFTFTRQGKFMEPYDDERVHHFGPLIIFLNPESLKTIKLKLWDDSKVISQDVYKETLATLLETDRLSYGYYDFIETDQWRAPNVVDIQEGDFHKDWKSFYHFQLIKCVSLSVKDVKKLVETYKQHVPKRGSIIKVQAENPLPFEAIRASISGLGEFDDPRNQNMFKFESNYNNQEITLQFKELEINVIEAPEIERTARRPSETPPEVQELRDAVIAINFS